MNAQSKLLIHYVHTEKEQLILHEMKKARNAVIHYDHFELAKFQLQYFYAT